MKNCAEINDAAISVDIDHKWRGMLIKSYLLVAMIVTAAETVILLFDKWAGVYYPPFYLFAIKYLVIPATVNLSAVFYGRRFVCREDVSEKAKNTVTCYVLFVICAVTQVTHCIFTPVLCSCSLATFMSCIFGDLKLTKGVFTLSFVPLGIAATENALIYHKGVNRVWIDVAVAALILICSYLSATTHIKKNAVSNMLIQKQLEAQRILIERIKHDSLTGLLNRTVLVDDLEAAVARKDIPMFLAMFDIDDFKSVNDSFGHTTGDRAICCLADIMQEQCSDNCLAYRYGGEEFAMLFTDTGREQVMATLEHIRERISRDSYNVVSIVTGEPLRQHITVSIGVKEYRDDISHSVWFNEADRALYISKGRGKNSITEL